MFYLVQEAAGPDPCCCTFLCPNCADRSTMSVHFLKANLAEEGCQEAQLDVAKKLLQDSKDADFMESVQSKDSAAKYYNLQLICIFLTARRQCKESSVLAREILRAREPRGHPTPPRMSSRSTRNHYSKPY